MRILTTGQTARELGCSRENILRLLEKTHIPVQRDSTGRRLLAPEDVEKLRRAVVAGKRRRE